MPKKQEEKRISRGVQRLNQLPQICKVFIQHTNIYLYLGKDPQVESIPPSTMISEPVV